MGWAESVKKLSPGSLIPDPEVKKSIGSRIQIPNIAFKQDNIFSYVILLFYAFIPVPLIR
jgi:hypothetical protein